MERIELVTRKLLKYCSMIYRLKILLSQIQFFELFDTLLHPVDQNGFLVYESTRATFLKPISLLLIARKLKISFWNPKYNSIKLSRIERIICNAGELHTYEISKLLLKLFTDKKFKTVPSGQSLKDLELRRALKKRKQRMFLC